MGDYMQPLKRRWQSSGVFTAIFLLSVLSTLNMFLFEEHPVCLILKSIWKNRTLSQSFLYRLIC